MSLDSLQAEATAPAAETHASVAQPTVEHKPQLLSYDYGVAAFTLITFLVLLVILKKFAWAPLLNAIEERDKYIKTSLNEAEVARMESRNIADQHKKVLDDARVQAQNMLIEAEAAAKAAKAKIEQAAHDERNRILADAERLVAQEKEKAMRDLRETVVKLSMDATRKLIDENLDEARSRAFVEKQIGMI